MSLISPNFGVKSIIFPNFGQGPFLKLLEKALIADFCRLRSTKLIFVHVGFSQLNSTTVLVFCTRHV